MHTMHPTLRIGPADWNPTRLPRDEFEDRIAQLWVDHPDAGGALVYGDPHDHSALSYLTHFTPKLEAGLALIPRDGTIRLLVGGGPNMVPAARPLTFVDELQALRGVAVAAEWARRLPNATKLVVLGGNSMPFGFHRALENALRDRRDPVPGDAELAGRMRVKSARELMILRRACALLSNGVDVLQEEFRRGAGVTDIILAAEHAVIGQGAQDVRSLFSLDSSMTLRPFDLPVPAKPDLLRSYFAVCFDGYWAEAFVSLSSGRDELALHTQRIVEALSAAARPGLSPAALWNITDEMRGPLSLHPLCVRSLGGVIGLSLGDGSLTRDSQAPLLAGEVYAVHVGLRDSDHAALASSMVCVTDMGVERLWPIGKCDERH
jgi:hypothetical protein